MSRNIYLKLILLFILLINIKFMNAQESIPASQSLNAQQQSIVSISALTAVGDLEHLKVVLNKALDAGVTINEVKEVLVQLYAYCGFPRSLNSISTFMKVLEERKSKGISDRQGNEVTISSDTSDKYEKGRKTLEALTKTPQIKPAPGFGEFAPRIDVFLKEHLFADIFQSNVLSYQQRELATIAALSAMQGVEPQLKSHLAMGINTGITESQLIEISNLIAKYINKTQANVLREMLSKPAIPIVAPDMMVRISEIEIAPEHVEEYNAILKEEAAASVKIELGVIAIFPMYQKENLTQIRIVEIYANKAAYESHLKTSHFQHYKTLTLKMVKSLKLIDMETLDSETMQEIFKKVK
jgi:4-carboxymuconolactone decarboxylase